MKLDLEIHNPKIGGSLPRPASTGAREALRPTRAQYAYIEESKTAPTILSHAK
jgi:hypothetical protein